VLQGEIANIRIPLLDVNIENNIAMGIVMAYHYSTFMVATGEIVPDQTALAAAMLGLLLNAIDYTRILEGPGELISHCIKEPNTCRTTRDFSLQFKQIQEESLESRYQ
jgi:hypothetical protein